MLPTHQIAQKWTVQYLHRRSRHFQFVRYECEPIQSSPPSSIIGFNGGDTNLYGYVVNDPINLIDLSGLSPIASGIIGAAVGGVVGGISATANGTSFGDGVTVGAISGFAIGSGAALFGWGAQIAGVGIGAEVFSGAVGGGLGGFTGNIVGQVAVTGNVDLPQAFLSAGFGGIGSGLVPLLGGSIAADIAVSTAMRPYEIGADVILNECRKAKTK